MKDFKAKWKLDATAETDWVDVMTRRIMNIFHVVNSKEGAKKPPDWVQQLPWMRTARGEVAETDAGLKKKKTADAEDAGTDVEYGFDSLLKLPWRQQAGKVSTRAYGQPLVVFLFSLFRFLFSGVSKIIKL